jgi:hypothetical protein
LSTLTLYRLQYTVVFGIEIILHFVVSFTKEVVPAGWVLVGVIFGGVGRVRRPALRLERFLIVPPGCTHVLVLPVLEAHASQWYAILENAIT